MTIEEKKKAIDALKISAPVMGVTQNEFNEYIQTINKIADWLEQKSSESKSLVYVVTYWDFTGDIKEEPVVTVFNNEEAAKKCYNHFKKYYPACVLDETFLYSSFELSFKKRRSRLINL